MSPRAKANPVNKTPRRQRGQGGVTKRSDGLWVGFIELPRDPVTGKRRRKQVTGRDFETTVQKLDQARADLREVGNLNTSEPTYEEWVDYWFKNIGEKKLRPSSILTYRKASRYAISVFGKKKLSQLKVADVRAFHESMLESRGLSSTTANQAHSILSKMLKDAVREDYVKRNVATLVDAPPVDNPDSDALSVDEALQLLSTIRDDRNASRWAFALLTGARQGECLGLKWQDVDFENERIYIEWQLLRLHWQHGCGTTETKWEVIGTNPNGKPKRTRVPANCGHRQAVYCPDRHVPMSPRWEHQHLGGNLWLGRPKTKTSRRSIKMVPVLRALFEAHREATRDDPNPDGWVWTAERKWRGGAAGHGVLAPLSGEPIDPANDRLEWKAMLRRAGLRTELRVHDARHTAITLLYELGVPEVFIQQIVGQADLGITRKYRKKDAESRAVADALNGMGETLNVRKPLEAVRDADPTIIKALDGLETRLDDAA